MIFSYHLIKMKITQFSQIMVQMTFHAKMYNVNIKTDGKTLRTIVSTIL